MTTVKYETGATNHVVNDLILFTDNTRELAAFRDNCHKLVLDRPRTRSKLTTPYFAQQIYGQLFDRARRAYYKEFPDNDSTQHIRDITDAQYSEYCLLYAQNFPEWERDYYSNKEA